MTLKMAVVSVPKMLLIKCFYFLGDITQKGYDKKRNKLLAPYMRKPKEHVVVTAVSIQPQNETTNSETVVTGHVSTPPNNKIDLKTPSFIPVDDSSRIDDIAVEAENRNEDIEPDSLDPNINNDLELQFQQLDQQQQQQQQQQQLPQTPQTLSQLPQTPLEEQRKNSAVVDVPPEVPPEVPPHVPPHKNAGAAFGAAPKKPRSRHRHKKHTHNEKRYHSEVRQEAVQQALAAMNQSKAVPMPSKRSSVMKTTTQNGDSEDEEGESSSGSEDDPGEVSASGGDQEQVRNVTLGMSDTSSNNSLARGAAILVSAAMTSAETPPSLPSRNIRPPPPPVTSPTRQNSR